MSQIVFDVADSTGNHTTVPVSVSVTQALDPKTAFLHTPWTGDAQAQGVDPNSATLIATWKSKGYIFSPNITTHRYASSWCYGRSTDKHYTIAAQRNHLDAGGIPIAAGSQVGGGDSHLTIFDLEHSRIHDLFGAAYNATSDTWSCTEGDSFAWGGKPTAGTGANAAGFPQTALAVWPEEIQAGVIPHALAFSTLHARPTTFRYPATKTDGNGASDDLEEGSWLRMPAAQAVNTAWPNWVKLCFTALKTYGMFLMDQGGSLGIEGINPINGGLDWSAVGVGTATQSSVGFPSDFPWDKMQVLVPPAP